MSNIILRHGAGPAMHPYKCRFRFDSEERAQFLLGKGRELVIREREHCFIARATKENTQQRTVSGSAVRKFLMHEGAGRQPALFAARDEKSEAAGKNPVDLLPGRAGVGERNSER